MANLLPPDAKKTLFIEYWLRVGTVWCILIASACVAIIFLQVPTYYLITQQLDAFSGAYNDAQTKQDTFKESQQIIIEANDLATMLAGGSEQIALSDLVPVLDDIAGSAVHIRDFDFSIKQTVEKKEKDSKSDSKKEASTPVEETLEIAVRGVADTRVALANFSQDIEAHPYFLSADLPISNLAKESDIPFSITIVFDPSYTP